MESRFPNKNASLVFLCLFYGCLWFAIDEQSAGISPMANPCNGLVRAHPLSRTLRRKAHTPMTPLRGPADFCPAGLPGSCSAKIPRAFLDYSRAFPCASRAGVLGDCSGNGREMLTENFPGTPAGQNNIVCRLTVPPRRDRDCNNKFSWPALKLPPRIVEVAGDSGDKVESGKGKVGSGTEESQVCCLVNEGQVCKDVDGIKGWVGVRGQLKKSASGGSPWGVHTGFMVLGGFQSP